jgi:hypothetical protein
MTAIEEFVEMEKLIMVIQSTTTSSSPTTTITTLHKLIEEWGGISRLQTYLEQNLKDKVNWKETIEQCEQKAESVFIGVSTKTPQKMDEQTQREVKLMALQEACGRSLKEIIMKYQASTSISSSSSTEIASPFADGARFNQISSVAMEQFLQQKLTFLPQYLPTEWESLAVLDAERAVRTKSIVDNSLTIVPSRHKLRFPALYSIAELISMFPNELNLKLRSTYREVHAEIWLWSNTFVIPKPVRASKHRVIAGYVFTRAAERITLSADEGHPMIEVRSNGVVLFSSTSPPFTPTLKFSTKDVWMLCVAFDCA